VRNHGGIPIIDSAAYKLSIGGLVNEPKTLTLADLQDSQKFEPVQVTVTLQVNSLKRIFFSEKLLLINFSVLVHVVSNKFLNILEKVMN